MSEQHDRHPETEPPESRPTFIDRVIRFCLENKLVVALFVVFMALWGVGVAPFAWDRGPLKMRTVPTDAIPDIGENQQIVFTEWMGRSPQDVEDQITYPLTVSLLGIPDVKTVRSFSFFGFSSIYVIFDEGIDFYWSRSRVLEKLNSLPAGTLPEGVQPALGPDATALGQIFWYTLEGRDPDGKPVGGWDLDELRAIQDWNVRYALLSARGISEVASVGGFVQEYQIDVDPDAMRAYGVTLDQIFSAVKASNIDVGARTIEMNRVEYVIRGLGFIRKVADIENTVVAQRQNVPVFVRNVAHVSRGPALRRGALDKEGAEAVGGVAVVRFGYNPLEAIDNLKKKIRLIAPNLPTRAVVDHDLVAREQAERFAADHGFDAYDGSALNHEAWLDWLRKHDRREWPKWVTTSRVSIVPFYDRTGLIYETLGTLNTALIEEILVTVIVVVLMVMHLRSSILISAALPLAVLMCFIAMRTFGVDANIVALSGIAIAIGTIVDMSIVICENVLRHLEAASGTAETATATAGESSLVIVFRAASEVGSAVLTAVSTTIVGFLPVFWMTGEEGKLFKPLAFTKTFALIASIIIALTVVPAGAHLLFPAKVRSRGWKRLLLAGLAAVGIVLGLFGFWYAGAAVLAIAVVCVVADFGGKGGARSAPVFGNVAVAFVVAFLLSRHWEPLGPERGALRNFIFVGGLVGGLIGFFFLFRRAYPFVLRFLLSFKSLLWVAAALIVVAGVVIWRGLGQEFMPPLDEGSYLYMPTTMPHASIGETLDVLSKQDMRLSAIPEIDNVVGKLGRAETPLDPAPISMIETVISYFPEYLSDRDGRRLTFAWTPDEDDFARSVEGALLPAPDGEPYLVRGRFERFDNGTLVPDPDGMPFRMWRPALDPELNPGRAAWPGVRNPQDIWELIQRAGEIPGTTSASKLQPIAARLVMLQSGMRTPLGVKVFGPDLQTVEAVGLQIEKLLREVPGVAPATVFAERIIGKPYIEIEPDREKIARYGIDIRRVQDVIEVAVGGRRITTTVEGRERYGVRVRYLRELRDEIGTITSDQAGTLGRILVAASDGAQVPLSELADIRLVRGPMSIKSENTFLVGYVTFDKLPDFAEVDVVTACRAHLDAKRKTGELNIPVGVTVEFAGTWENQVRARQTLFVVVPVALFVIFMILYFQFRSAPTTLLVFSGILVAWGGGFLMIWAYAQPWFLDFSVFGVNMRDLFQVHPINLSIAVWVGFLALFGIASDDGVVMATYLEQSFARRRALTLAELRSATLAGAERRIRPCLMTSATTILALIPVLTSTGRGSDVMIPMALASFGGMTIELLTMFVVPVGYCAVAEFRRDLEGRFPSWAISAICFFSFFTVPVIWSDVAGLARRIRD